MASSKKHPLKKKRPERPAILPGKNAMMPLEDTGSESAYLKSLVDSRAKVTVVLNTGEEFRGRIRYYDRHCFSIGLSAEGPRLFLRKASVAHIIEE